MVKKNKELKKHEENYIHINKTFFMFVLYVIFILINLYSIYTVKKMFQTLYGASVFNLDVFIYGSLQIFIILYSIYTFLNSFFDDELF